MHNILSKTGECILLKGFFRICSLKPSWLNDIDKKMHSGKVSLVWFHLGFNFNVGNSMTRSTHLFCEFNTFTFQAVESIYTTIWIVRCALGVVMSSRLMSSITIKPCILQNFFFDKFVANVLHDNMDIIIFDLRGCEGCLRPKTSSIDAHFGT